jgi:class 3 adenylate cyclase
MFCDLVGFTAASEAADPEDVRARLRPYHARVRDVIDGHGGTVEKFVGDAGAEAPLAEARDLFASMGYEPALAETEGLLAETVAEPA